MLFVELRNLYDRKTDTAVDTGNCRYYLSHPERDANLRTVPSRVFPFPAITVATHVSWFLEFSQASDESHGFSSWKTYMSICCTGVTKLLPSSWAQLWPFVVKDCPS